jgi:hypothetical protein
MDLVDIGPEIFGKADGSVICWKGVNYVRQEDARTAILQAAGGGAGAVMKKAPNVVMPTEEIIPLCEQLFSELNNGTLHREEQRQEELT